ncbi:MAG: hypothetical protein NTV06_09015 [candidate division Zixibacteria bacterium]|nr:hypothetical protein [candidate division Zixibacteria bacterium]
MTFMEPDFLKFPLLEMGYKVAQAGGTIPAVFNAANEVAVNAFLKDAIKFITIPDIIIKTVEKHKMIEKPAYDDIVEADQWARKTALDIIG